MTKMCSSIRALQLAAVAGACLIGTSVFAQTKAAGPNKVAAKLRPVAKQPLVRSGLKSMVEYRPSMMSDPVEANGTPAPAPRGPGLGACTDPFGGPCQNLTQADCTAIGGTWLGAGSSCPVSECSGVTFCQPFEYPRVGGTSFAIMGTNYIADAFKTDASANHTLTDFCYWGAYTNAASGAAYFPCATAPVPQVDNINITIYELTGGVPDVTLPVDGGTRYQGTDFTLVRRDFCDAARQSHEFHIHFNPGREIHLQANHCYAVEINNPNDGTLNAFWSRSRPGGFAANDGIFWQRTSPTAAYSASGVNLGGDRAWCMNVGLDIQNTCSTPPPPICTNPDVNGQAFGGVNLGGFSASPSANAVGLQLAERVQFAAAGNISKVCFRGFWVSLVDGTQPTGPDAPDFDITYYANDNGQPGAQIATFRAGTGGTQVFRQGNQYRIEHAPVAVQAHTCYFFSISRVSETADPDHNLRFAWWLTAANATPGVGDDTAHSRAAGGATPGAWANINFGAGQGDIHFLMDEGAVEQPNCPITSGACCVAGVCSTTTEANCLAQGGTFQGLGSVCGANTCVPPPANDNCSAATAISGVGNFPYSNVNASVEATEILASCATSGASIWFTWTAPCAGDFEVSNCAGSVDDTVIAAYSGTCAGATEVACGDDSCGIGGGPSTVTITGATGGSQYLIRVASWTGTEGGAAAGATGTLAISRVGGDCPASCPCDFDHSGALNSADFFSFLTAFFQGLATADFDGSGTINSADFFAFLTCFFSPPSGCF